MADSRTTRNDAPQAESLREEARPAVAPRNTIAQAIAAHPFGSIAGALLGLAVGALAGIAAGPLGSLFGALCGAVLGLVLGTSGRGTAAGSPESKSGR